MIIRWLQAAIDIPDVRETMDMEDEILEELQDKERELAKKEKAIKEKDKALAENNKALIEKDKRLEANEVLIKKLMDEIEQSKKENRGVKW